MKTKNYRDVYFSSDPHYSHRNIIKYCNRPFKNSDEMNKFLINAWNNKIPQKSEVYFLGDFHMGGSTSFDEVTDIISQLNGQIHVIKGNHDNDSLWKLIENAKLPNIISISESKNINVTLEDGRYQKIHLSHYPHRDWNASYHGGWHLFGHTHGQLEMYGKSMDVGVDTNSNYEPWSLSDVTKILDNQPNVQVGQAR